MTVIKDAPSMKPASRIMAWESMGQGGSEFNRRQRGVAGTSRRGRRSLGTGRVLPSHHLTST